MKTWHIIAIGAGMAAITGVVVYYATKEDTTITTTTNPNTSTMERPIDAGAEVARGLSNVADRVAGAIAAGEQRRLDREAEERRQRREDELHERDRREAREDRTNR